MASENEPPLSLSFGKKLLVFNKIGCIKLLFSTSRYLENDSASIREKNAKKLNMWICMLFGMYKPWQIFYYLSEDSESKAFIL